MGKAASNLPVPQMPGQSPQRGTSGIFGQDVIICGYWYGAPMDTEVGL